MKIMECNSCKPHSFQDEKLGKMKRWFTKGGSADNPKYRCTVCSKEVGTSLVKK